MQPPPLWGNEDHVRALLGDRVDDVTARRGTLTVDHFPTGAAFRDYFKANYGPTITAYRNIADDPARVAALDAELADLGDRALAGSVDDGVGVPARHRPQALIWPSRTAELSARPPSIEVEPQR